MPNPKQADRIGTRRIIKRIRRLAVCLVFAGGYLAVHGLAAEADSSPEAAPPAEEKATVKAAKTQALQVDFATQILPILSDNCFACHGADAQTRKADLRLDQRESAVDESLVIEPGNALVSILVKRITTTQSRELMPPPSFNKTLEADEIALIKKWIDQGADYQPHWAFVKPVQAPLPEVDRADWPTNAIDHFVLAKLEQAKLAPAPSADKSSLIRRLTLDLTGLPPTREEVLAFNEDTSQNAYEKVVDRLLDSPRYGEHMTRYWLDAVRYGDTHGLHLDNYRSIWPYRDWVINAFNQNMAYDQFTTEQLAGDLLEKPTLQQLIATGYNRCNITTSEGGTIPEEVYVRNVIDRVETTSTIWLGLTTGCAACHDHKYDPVSQKEFYKLFAFFNSFDGNPRDNNRADHAPNVRVPDEETKRQLADFDKQLAAITAQIAAHPAKAEPAFQAWIVQQNNAQDTKPALALKEGLLVYLPLDEGKGNQAVNQVDADQPGSVLGKARWAVGHLEGGYSFDAGDRIEFSKSLANFDQDQAFSYGAWIKTPGNITGAAIAKMDQKTAYRGWDLYIDQRRVAMHLIHAWPGKSLKVTTKADVLKPNTWQHVFVTYDGSKKASGVTLYVDGKAQPFTASHDTLDGTTTTSAPLTLGRRTADSPFTKGAIDDVRIYLRTLTAAQVAVLAKSDTIASLLAIPAEQRTPQQVQSLRQHYLQSVDAVYPKHLVDRNKLKAQREKLHKNTPLTLVYRETKEPRKAYLLSRGQYDQKRDEVQRGVPDFLPPMAEGLPTNRLGLAKWMMHPDHPLTARVTVNRFWQQLFGVGLVKTSEDFGVQGEQPSHPALLDWLAVQFIKDGWDVKQTMKRMVMSSTYRQSAAVGHKAYKQDPENRLLARGPRLRLDAEVLRDQALAASGLLNNTIGGPSVKPPQPAGIWKAVGYESSNTANFKADTGDKVYRRSMYVFWKRTAPAPFLVGFDAPNRESCTVRRERTNTAMQALIVLNEPQYVESARRLAERVMNEAKRDTQQRITWLYQRTVMRDPTPTEMSILLDGFAEQLAIYQQDPDAAKQFIATGTSKPDPKLDPATLAAWTMTASTVINLDEFINKP